MYNRISEFVDAVNSANEIATALKDWLFSWGNYMLKGGTRPPTKPPTIV